LASFLDLLSGVQASGFVNAVMVALVHVDDKDKVITEATKSVHSRHGDDE